MVKKKGVLYFAAIYQMSSYQEMPEDYPRHAGFICLQNRWKSL
jgi:hypothetical protein